MRLIAILRKMFWYYLGAWEGDLDPKTGKLRPFNESN